MSDARNCQVIRASAGAGKTFALSNRFISLLRTGVRPETILATTFTRKAAGEILERVLRRLAGAARSEQGAAALGEQLNDHSLTLPDSRSMLSVVCAALHHVSICTIDSFFNRVGSSFRYELGIAPSTTMVGDDDPRVTQLRATAIEAVLADDDPQVLVDLLRRLHHDTARRSVTEAIDKVIGDVYQTYCQAPDRETWARVQPPETLDAANLRTAIDAAADYVQTFTGDKRVSKAMSVLLEAANTGDWKELLASGFAKYIAQGNYVYYNKPLPDELIGAIKPLIINAQAQLVSYCLHETLATHDLLSRFDAHYTQLRRQHRVLLFHDLPRKLARELPQRDDLMRDVYFRLDAAVEHLMLDEFQDTSIDQWTVLRPFAEEIRAYGDGSRTFFCVGDVKQAIYGWRGGCAEIFDRIETDLNLDDDGVEQLNVNYRSSPIVLDVVNEVFGSIAQNEALVPFDEHRTAWASRFHTHEAKRTQQAGYVELIESPRVEVETSHDVTDDDDDEPSDLGDPHVLFTADRIAALARKAPGRSIGVLLRRKKMSKPLLHHLHERGIVASGESGNLLTDDPAVNVILAALTLADHPGDRVAAFHVLNSPLGDIVGLRSAHRSDATHTAQHIRAMLIDHGYAHVISHWAERLAPFGHARTAARLTQLVELANAYDPSLTLRPRHFVDYARATEVEELAPASVRIMTIHASKGLEFDIVVLPDLDNAMVRNTGHATYTLRASETGPIHAVFRGTNQQVRDRIGMIEAAYKQEEARSFRDAMCTMYVAMTRPRHALHMIIKPIKLKNDGTPSAAKSPTYARVLRAALVADQSSETADIPLYTHGDAQWYARDADGRATETPAATPTPSPLRPQLASESRSARRSRPQVAPSSLEGGGHVRIADLLGMTPSMGRERGSIMHAWLQRVEFLDASREHAAIAEAELISAAQQVSPSMDAATLNAYREAFEAILAQPIVRQVLSRPDGGDVQLWRERPFAVVLEDKLVRGVFDRVVVHYDGDTPVRAELIDFKTDRITDEGFGATVDTYRPQMRAYMRALSLMLHLDMSAIQAALLFVGSDPPRHMPIDG